MSAERSLGTTLAKTSGTPLTVGDLTSISEIGIESEEIDVTTLGSSSGFKEFIAGSKDAGDLTVSAIIKAETNLETLVALANARTVEEWAITTASGSTWTFSGFVKSFKEGEASVDGVRTFTMVIRISGEPVYASVEVSA